MAECCYCIFGYNLPEITMIIDKSGNVLYDKENKKKYNSGLITTKAGENL